MRCATTARVPRPSMAGLGVNRSTSGLVSIFPRSSHPLTISVLPSGRVVTVGYQRPARMSG
ncbi:MAG: hypothetical protein AB7O78_15035 [Thermoleophilia bacterium]